MPIEAIACNDCHSEETEWVCTDCHALWCERCLRENGDECDCGKEDEGEEELGEDMSGMFGVSGMSGGTTAL